MHVALASGPLPTTNEPRRSILLDEVAYHAAAAHGPNIGPCACGVIGVVASVGREKVSSSVDAQIRW